MESHGKNVFSRTHWPLVVTVAAYWATVATLVWLSLQQNQGQLVYPLDDTYVHLAIAKNLILHGVWGITPDGFTSSTSSPLWTFLLALVWCLFGVRDAAPLVLNILFGTLLIGAVYVCPRRRVACSSSFVFVVLFLLVFSTPLPALTLAGMEHTLHALLAVLFAHRSAAMLSSSRKPAIGYFAQWLALAACMVMARYEGLFALSVVAALLIFARKLSWAILLVIAGALPVAGYGLWAVSHGWYFLPNSVLLKGSFPGFSLSQILTWILSFFGRILLNPDILLLLAASLFVLLGLTGEKSWGYRTSLVLIFVGATLLHMLFATTGWFYRYEAYLVALGIFCLGAAVADWVSNVSRDVRIHLESVPLYATVMLLLVVWVFPFAQRAGDSLKEAPQAANNIYEQQFQVAMFLNRFYNGRTVALNDIGAVSYLADVRLLDLWGLGSMPVARLKLTHAWDQGQVSRLAREDGVDIAVVYDAWYADIGGLPSDWERVGQWTVQNNVVLGDSTISLYCVNPSERNTLIEDLKQFSAALPQDVKQSGEYTRGGP
jgi:hypothetical protein